MEGRGVAPPAPGVTLTRRGWTLAGAAAGLVLGSRVLGAGPLAGLGIGAALLLGVGVVWVRARRPALRMTRSVRPARLHVGTEGRIVLEGVTTTATPLLTLTDRIDDGKRAARFLVPPGDADETIRAVYRIPTRRRGRHLVGPLVGSITDPFGVVRRTFPITEPNDVVICPRVHAVVPPARGGGGEPAAHAEGARAPALEPLGEFLALRDYEPGDDPRRVHWRMSARRGELLVRQDEAASPGRVVLVLDTRSHVHDEASFESAVEIVASLAVALRRAHAPLEAVTTKGEVLGRPGPGMVELLLERLAVVSTGDPDYLTRVVAGLRDRLGIGAVVGATGYLDDEFADALALLRPRCLVTAIATGSSSDARALIPVVDASTDFPAAWNRFASRSSRRWNLVSSRSL
ncbi:MAG: DUF58 domain-containing protein [Actinobacteria bacterium]|nr:DUF58 domain-containing protein [Actinomycetota bacterium]